MGRNGGRAGNDERRAGLVDQDRVHLIDNREVMSALDLLVAGGGHAIVAEVIEAEFAVRAVNNVARILLATVRGSLVVLEHADSEAEELVELAHPLGVASCEVVVHGDDMNAATRKGIEINGESGDEGFALAGGHLGDAAVVEHHAADELDIEVHHVPSERVAADIDGFSTKTARAVFHNRKSLGEDLVEFAGEFGGVGDFGEAILPLEGLRPQSLIGSGLEGGVELVDFFDSRQHATQLALIFATDDFFQDPSEHDEKVNRLSKSQGRRLGMRNSKRVM